MQSPLVVQRYNSLQDEHLVEYYSSPHRRRHLRRMGLITKDGRLVDELTFQRRALHRECSDRHRETMAAVAATKISDAQRLRRAELKKKLESLAKYETVRRIKKEKLHPLGIQWHCPRNIHPISGQGSPGPGQAVDHFPHHRLSRILETHKDKVSFSPEELKDFKQLVETITGASMITPPPVGTFPHPPSKPRPKNSAAVKVQSGHVVRRRPQTAPTKSQRYESSPIKRTAETSNQMVEVTLRFLGNLSTSRTMRRRRKKTKGTASQRTESDLSLTEVVIQQQARGYTPLPVHRGQHRPGDSFSFRSIRHSGMPYALVLYTGGMIDCRVSVCCEYRHRPGTLLGGKSAHFKVVSVKGGSPCYKCQTPIEEGSRKSNQIPLHESTDSELEHHASTDHFSTLTQITSTPCLESPLRENSLAEENGKSPSPLSSLYSASFHSNSPPLSSDNDERENPSQTSLHPSRENLHVGTLDSQVAAETHDHNITTESRCSDPHIQAEEHDTVNDKENCQLVTRGGVTIAYELGPISTSESATQTDEQQADVGMNTPHTDTVSHNSSPSSSLKRINTPPKVSTDDQNKKEDTGREEGQNEVTENDELQTEEREGPEDGEVKMKPLTQISDQTIEEESNLPTQNETTHQAITDNESPVSKTSLPDEVAPVLQDSNESISTDPEHTDQTVTNTVRDKEAAQLSDPPHEDSRSSSHPSLQNEPIAASGAESTPENTLTQVSERKTSTETNVVSPPLSDSEPQTRLTDSVSHGGHEGATTHKTEDTDNGNITDTSPHASEDTGTNTQTENTITSGELKSTAIREEEFTKAWT